MAELSERDLELIDRYIKKEMNAAELSAFEARIQKEENLRHELNATAFIVGGLENDSEEKQLLGQFEEFYKVIQVQAGNENEPTDDMHDKLPVTGKRVSFFTMNRLSMAAVVAFAMLGGWFLLEFSNINFSEKQDIAASKSKVYHIPFSDTGEGLGFTSTVNSDSTIQVRVVIDSLSYLKHYQFTNSLLLLLDTFPQPSDSLSLLYEPVSEKYLLRYKGDSYLLDRGFKKVFPLEKRIDD